MAVAPPEENGSGFTNKEIVTEVRGLRDIVLDVVRKVDLLTEKFSWAQEQAKTHQESSDKVHSDHETRLRANDRWRYAVPGGIVMIVITAAIGLFALFRH